MVTRQLWAVALLSVCPLALVRCGGVTRSSGGAGTAGATTGGGGAGTGGRGNAGTAGSGGLSELCKLPKVVGPCDAAFQAWWHNPATGICEPFVYGGCEGNANNFPTLNACQTACQGGQPDMDAVGFLR